MIQSAASAIQQSSLANQADTIGASQRILTAIKTAANQTGVDFSYLLKKASQESSFDANAKATGSSATGLYQFTKQTWLQMVKNYGGKYGLGTYADHIQMDSNGVAHVSDPTWKQAILNLRKDPIAASEMAGEYDKENQVALEDNVGGKIGATELYLAHFLGASGASNFLNEMRSNPKQAAADVLPTAAASNPHVFYAKDGTPRSLQQIYQHFAQKFDSNSSSTTMVASASPHATQYASFASIAAPATVVASTPLSSTGALGGGSINPSTVTAATNGLRAEGSSLIATMILAQMHDQPSTTSMNHADNQNQKKTPFDLLSVGTIG